MVWVAGQPDRPSFEKGSHGDCSALLATTLILVTVGGAAAHAEVRELIFFAGQVEKEVVSTKRRCRNYFRVSLRPIQQVARGATLGEGWFLLQKKKPGKQVESFEPISHRLVLCRPAVPSGPFTLSYTGTSAEKQGGAISLANPFALIGRHSASLPAPRWPWRERPACLSASPQWSALPASISAVARASTGGNERRSFGWLEANESIRIGHFRVSATQPPPASPANARTRGDRPSPGTAHRTAPGLFPQVKRRLSIRRAPCANAWRMNRQAGLDRSGTGPPRWSNSRPERFLLSLQSGRNPKRYLGGGSPQYTGSDPETVPLPGPGGIKDGDWLILGKFELRFFRDRLSRRPGQGGQNRGRKWQRSPRSPRPSPRPPDLLELTPVKTGDNALMPRPFNLNAVWDTPGVDSRFAAVSP